VLRDRTETALLDSYEGEFRPVAEHNVIRSADPTGGARGVDQELHVDLGARIPTCGAPRPPAGSPLSTTAADGKTASGTTVVRRGAG
jgi:hypothetical protein